MGEPVEYLHVGYPKSASTWLQRVVFQEHPDLDVASKDPEIRILLDAVGGPGGDSGVELLGAAAGRRRQSVGKAQIITRETLIRTPLDNHVGDTFETADRLATACPGARVLIVVRRQQDLIPSLYSQYVHEGGTRSLEDSVAGRDPTFPLDDLSSMDMAAVVEHYRTRFGADQVVVVPFELLRSDPSAFLDAIEAFLGFGLDRDGLDMAPSNPSTVPSLLPVLRLWNRLIRRSRFNASPPLGFVGGHLWGRKLLQGRISTLARRLGLAGRRLTLPEDFAARLRSHVTAPNRALQAHVSADLSELGYWL